MAEAKDSKKQNVKSKKEGELTSEMVAEATPVVNEEIEAAEPKATTKAGKHSAKAVKEAEEKQAKEIRKVTKTVKPDDAKKLATKKPRSRVERAGKKYRELAKQVDQSKTYSLPDALELAVKTNPAKFDATVELHINLGVDPKQADHNIRGVVALPSGSGKNVRVAVFAEADDAAKAKKAGADITGQEELTALLDKEQIDFDVLVAVPTMMPKLGKYAKLLGPRGLMPNPKSGTVTPDVAKAVAEAKAGRVEYRLDQAGIVHLGIGKVSFGAEKLEQNALAILSAIRAAKPASLKGTYIESIFVATSMGPSIKVAL